MTKKEFKEFLKSDEFKKLVKKEILDGLKNDNRVRQEVYEISKDVLIKLYKAFWVKRNFWTNYIK
jgi:hypothetical protein